MIEVQIGPCYVQTAEDFYMSDLCFGCVFKTLQFFTRNDQSATSVEMKYNYIGIRLVLA